jgi:hypothetical protein
MRLQCPKAPLDLQRLAWLAPPPNPIPAFFHALSVAHFVIPPPSTGILYTTPRNEHVKPQRGLGSFAAVISLKRIQKANSRFISIIKAF